MASPSCGDLNDEVRRQAKKSGDNSKVSVRKQPSLTTWSQKGASLSRDFRQKDHYISKVRSNTDVGVGGKHNGGEAGKAVYSGQSEKVTIPSLIPHKRSQEDSHDDECEVRLSDDEDIGGQGDAGRVLQSKIGRKRMPSEKSTHSYYSQNQEEMILSHVSEGVGEDEMYPEHRGYHHAITSKEAEQRLAKKGGNCYLTRYSDTNRCYVLSVYQSTPTTKIKHFKICRSEGGKYSIERKQKSFDDIESMLCYYEMNSIDPAFKTIGRKCVEEDYMNQGCCTIA